MIKQLSKPEMNRIRESNQIDLFEPRRFQIEQERKRRYTTYYMFTYNQLLIANNMKSASKY